MKAAGPGRRHFITALPMKPVCLSDEEDALQYIFVCVCVDENMTQKRMSFL